ncbi:Rad51d, partial [Symbiodinium sp. KB8]
MAGRAEVRAAAGFEAAHRLLGDVFPCGGQTLTELSGGCCSGEVTEVFGGPGSGKTQVCLATAVATVLRRDVGVYFFTTAPVPATASRLLEVCKARVGEVLGGEVRFACVAHLCRDTALALPAAQGGRQAGARFSQVRSTAVKHVLSLIHLEAVPSIHGLCSKLEALASATRGGSAAGTGLSPAQVKGIGLVIVDSMHTAALELVGKPASDAASRGRADPAPALLRSLGRSLRHLAASGNTAVLVTNGCGREDAPAGLDGLPPLCAAPRWAGARTDKDSRWQAHCQVCCE